MSQTILPGWGLAISGILLAAVAATTAPLLTYTLTLAVFGGAHVFYELRFVEARFSARFAPRILAGIGTFLAGIVLLRFLRALGIWSTTSSVEFELIAVAGLGALTLPTLMSAGIRPLLIGSGVVCAVSIGVVVEPIWTIVALACLHNWTPVGFLAEGLPAPDRRRGLLLVGLAFGVVPVLIATGTPTRLIGAAWQELTILPTGTLADNLSAYLPREVHDTDWAVSAFSAFVFAQCMHYATVIGVLPRIAPGGPQADAVVGMSRISGRTWMIGVVVLSAVGLIGYTLDFRVARSWYALIAAVHAWVEVPVLLVALVPGLRPRAAA